MRLGCLKATKPRVRRIDPIRFLLAVLTAWAASGAAAQDCGPDTPCQIENGSYYLRVPDGPGPYPVLVWFHGANSNGASIHRAGGLQRDFLEHGYALLAPNGQTRPNRGPSRFFFPGRDGSERDDVAFTLAALEAAQQRADLDVNRLYAAGFSAGGSMAWLLACKEGHRLSGMVSVAGALRRPNATDCSGLKGLPVMQVHGFADGQVPLEGRGTPDRHQGDVWQILKRAREANGCRSNPDDINIDDAFRSRTWDATCTRSTVRLDLHDGGHGLPRGWSGRARAFFESALIETR
ncbi:dienelactone hydrolase family protein [Rhodobacteraceae bacterium]|nr:dienelactone hydrolase family protein [Paracoccaceae bacterium]